MRYLILCISLVAFSACTHRVDLMKVAAVSMKERDLPVGKKLAKTGPITTKFCTSMSSSSGKSLGLIDEAVSAAEKEQKIDYILNAYVYTEGSCTFVEGDGARISDK